MLSIEQHETVVAALVEFIERATKEGAAPAEVAALPEVAKILLI